MWTLQSGKKPNSDLSQRGVCTGKVKAANI